MSFLVVVVFCCGVFFCVFAVVWRGVFSFVCFVCFRVVFRSLFGSIIMFRRLLLHSFCDFSLYLTWCT